MQNPIDIVPCYSITPSQIVSFSKVMKPISNDDLNGQVFGFPKKLKSLNPSEANKPSVVRSFHNFDISVNARRSLKQKINWLYFLSKKKTIKSYSGKTIYNFRMSFVTLTLPSVQEHPTQQITSEILNPFLTYLRKTYKLTNYVWRLEYQQNGNVHYHLVTDLYLDYFLILRHWNHFLNKLGYIDRFTKKMNCFTLSSYFQAYFNSDSSKFEIAKQRYAKGVKTKWATPPSVDVKSVIGSKQISNYISKYFAKRSKYDVNHNSLDNKENSSNMRLWFCSRTLSKLKTVNGVIGDCFVDVVQLAKEIPNLRKHFGQYATVYYISFDQLGIFYKKVIGTILRDYAFSQGYFAKASSG